MTNKRGEGRGGGRKGCGRRDVTWGRSRERSVTLIVCACVVVGGGMLQCLFR